MGSLFVIYLLLSASKYRLHLCGIPVGKHKNIVLKQPLARPSPIMAHAIGKFRNVYGRLPRRLPTYGQWCRQAVPSSFSFLESYSSYGMKKKVLLHRELMTSSCFYLPLQVSPVSTLQLVEFESASRNYRYSFFNYHRTIIHKRALIINNNDKPQTCEIGFRITLCT